MLFRASLLAPLAIALSTYTFDAAADAAYYRWVDERGQIVHSDRPPPKGIDYEVASVKSSARRVVDEQEGAVPRTVEPTAGNRFEPVDTEVRIEKNPEYCARAKQNLENLANYARIRVRGDDGEYRYLSEEEKEEKRVEARQSIKHYCE